MAMDGVDSGRLAQIRQSGAGKDQEDKAGTDNALMDLLTDAVNTGTGMMKIAAIGVVGQIGSASAAAGLEAGGHAAKQIMVGLGSFSGATNSKNIIAQIWEALKRGGTSIKNLAEGIENGSLIEGVPIQAAEQISMASLGNFQPDYTPGMGQSRGFDMSVA